MKQSFLVRTKEFFAKKSKTPWAVFETAGPSPDGILEFSISWNNAFVEKLKKQGYEGANDEEIVHIFFLSTRVLPENLLNDVADDSVNPEAMPRLSSEANFLRK
jgi:hypothetical protein